MSVKPGKVDEMKKELMTDLKAMIDTPQKPRGFGYQPNPWTWRNPTCYPIDKSKKKMMYYLTWADGGSTALILALLIFWELHAQDMPRFHVESPIGNPGPWLLGGGVGACFLSWAMSLFIIFREKKKKQRPWNYYLWIVVRLLTLVPLVLELVYVCHTIHISDCSAEIVEAVHEHRCENFLEPLIFEAAFLPAFMLIHLWCACIMAAYSLFFHKHR